MTLPVGTGGLVRLVVARDKWRFLVWLAGILVLLIVTISSTKGLFPDQKSLDEAAAVSRDNPAALAFNGPDQALDTIGGQIAFQGGTYTLLLTGLMSILLAGRLTRAEEDSGRLELVRALPVSRQAPLSAAVVVIGALLVAIGGLSIAALLLYDLPVAGSIAFGLSFTVVGLVFLGVALVTAQVSENPRVGSGIAGAVLGASFVLRAVGDMGDGRASWLSPIGWGQKARPYAGEVWWPLLLCVVVGVGLVVAAGTLMARRDFGAGLVPARPGPARGTEALASPLGLARRLDRGAVLWWAVGAVAMAAAYGSLAGSIDDFVTDNESMAKVLGAVAGVDLTDSYLATCLEFTALVAAGLALQVVLRLRTEEAASRAEVVLATRTPRSRWLGSHLAVALAGSGAAQVLGGAALGAAYWATGGDADQIGRLALAAAAYVPAIWVLATLALALYGVVPRFALWAWSGLVLAAVLSFFGALLDLPQWVMDLSPFEHIPFVPAVDPVADPIVGVTIAAIALGVVGVIGFQRRDVGI